MATAPQTPPKKKLILTPPDQPASKTEGSIRNFIIFLISLVLLLFGILAFGVLFLLPDREAALQDQQQLPQDIAAVEQTDNGKVPQQTAKVPETEPAAKVRAKQNLNDFLQLKSELELDGIGRWGGDEYTAVLQTADRGDSRLREGSFAEAEKIYGVALSQLRTLQNQKQRIFSRALSLGAEYLERKEGEMAKEAFKVAVAIDPQSEQAGIGLQRAGNLAQVVTYYEAGSQLEKEGEIVAALEEYKKSKTLDPWFNPASDAVSRLEEILRRQKLQEALTLFHNGLKRGQLEEAKMALQTAVGIAPGDPAVAAAREAYVLEEEASVIRHLKVQAEKEMAGEEWKNGVSVYSRILTLAPQAEFAQQGLEAAKMMYDFEQRMVFFLQNQQRLQNYSVLKNAEQTLEYARSLDTLGPKMSGMVEKLTAAVSKAKSLNILRLHSDNMTEVAIFHVGRLGRFLAREIELRPGKYTITGERAGFRSVRHVIEITSDKPVAEFTIICRERF